MTLKKSQQVLAQRFYNAFLLEFNISKRLLDEAQSFINRNSILLDPESKEKVCCPRCLKAHIIKKSQQLNITPNYEELDRLIEDEAGHEGYYLDGDEVIEYNPE